MESIFVGLRARQIALFRIKLFDETVCCKRINKAFFKKWEDEKEKSVAKQVTRLLYKTSIQW